MIVVVLTAFHIAIICGVIVLAFIGLACMARRMAINPIEDTPPASWLAKMEERG